jgi:ATP-dependent DNA ligase
MRKSNWTPSIVPRGDDQNVYIVLDDFRRNGRAYRETDPEQADLEAVIVDMLEGQYQNPVRVVGFNTAEHWSEDVSADALIRKTQPYAKRIAHKGIWVDPQISAEIEYRAKSAEGKVRHPFFKGIRDDL